MILRLYSTAACHLCEEAATLLHGIAKEIDIEWTEIDIVDHDELMQRYALEIPVLHRLDTDQILNWPFSRHDILALLRTDD
ncbi:MAG TPA: glutaredoxin family protein [Methylophilaceae bacterium]|nr:glutaredoxin family protein [Methylophilaceae bacterium]